MSQHAPAAQPADLEDAQSNVRAGPGTIRMMIRPSRPPVIPITMRTEMDIQPAPCPER
jgi:hypothetical protein